jgi:RNA polymerase sigma factor (TIGR02999 family)
MLPGYPMTLQTSPPEGETPPPGEITTLLKAAEAGDHGAVDRLFSAVYGEMRKLAHRELASAGLHGTMNTTALVHETYLKLSRGNAWSVRDRFHFYATAARAMRMVLIDDARHRLRDKRGAGRADLPLDDAEAVLPAPEKTEELLALDEALKRLETEAPELARVVEWRFFAGLSVEDIAKTLEVSDRTVRRQWRAARAFLYRSLAAPAAPS